MKTTQFTKLALAGSISLILSGCGSDEPVETALTAADAEAYVQEAEQRIESLYEYAAKSSWIAQTYINEDSQFLEARANEQFKLLGIELAAGAARFNGMDLPYDTQRKLNMLRVG